MKIIIPTRPQPDTIVAIFLLKTFGLEAFPGIADATVEIQSKLPVGETYESMLEEGAVLLDVGGGVFDHHGTNDCAAELVAKYLGIDTDQALAQLIQYAARDDKRGMGTISKDSIDRAFGLSGLIGSLNKTIHDDAERIVSTVFPLLVAHYHASNEHHNEWPQEIERMRTEGSFEECHIMQGNKELRVAYAISQKPTLATYLRSQKGGMFAVVVQKLANSNHICVLTRQKLQVDLRGVAGVIRMREAQLRNIELKDEIEHVTSTGALDEMSWWYYDPATNSLLNGGPHNTYIDATIIPWPEVKKLVRVGLEIPLEQLGSSTKK